MFTMGYNVFGDTDSYFATMNSVYRYDRIELQDIVIDEIHVSNVSSVPYSTDKTMWTFSSRLLARFRNNLEAGNIDINGLTVQYIKLKRRIKGEIEWQDYGIWQFDPDNLVYEFYDKYVANDEYYEYAVVPAAAGGVEGVWNYAEVHVTHNNYWLMDKTHSYRLTLNAALNNVRERIMSATFTPMGSRYPIVSFNSEIDYTYGNFNGTFYIDEDNMCLALQSDPMLNIKQARDFKRNFKQFLKNKLPKVLKDQAGNMWLCVVNDEISVEYNNESLNIFADISFPWIEIGDVENADHLRKRGLLDTYI